MAPTPTPRYQEQAAASSAGAADTQAASKQHEVIEISSDEEDEEGGGSCGTLVRSTNGTGGAAEDTASVKVEAANTQATSLLEQIRRRRRHSTEASEEQSPKRRRASTGTETQLRTSQSPQRLHALISIEPVSSPAETDRATVAHRTEPGDWRSLQADLLTMLVRRMHAMSSSKWSIDDVDSLLRPRFVDVAEALEAASDHEPMDDLRNRITELVEQLPRSDEVEGSKLLSEPVAISTSSDSLPLSSRAAITALEDLVRALIRRHEAMQAASATEVEKITNVRQRLRDVKINTKARLADSTHALQTAEERMNRALKIYDDRGDAVVSEIEQRKNVLLQGGLSDKNAQAEASCAVAISRELHIVKLRDSHAQSKELYSVCCRDVQSAIARRVVGEKLEALRTTVTPHVKEWLAKSMNQVEANKDRIREEFAVATAQCVDRLVLAVAGFFTSEFERRSRVDETRISREVELKQAETDYTDGNYEEEKARLSKLIAQGKNELMGIDKALAAIASSQQLLWEGEASVLSGELLAVLASKYESNTGGRAGEVMRLCAATIQGRLPVSSACTLQATDSLDETASQKTPAAVARGIDQCQVEEYEEMVQGGDTREEAEQGTEDDARVQVEQRTDEDMHGQVEQRADVGMHEHVEQRARQAKNGPSMWNRLW